MQKLTVGLRKDENIINQPEGSWRDARNIVVRKSTEAVSNEDGVDDVTPNNYPSKQVIGVIETSTEKIFFFGSTVVTDSEIGIVDINNNYRTIIKDNINTTNNILNFNINFPIQGTFENKYNNNIVIAWGDRGYNPPRILNIDCLPFNIDPNTFNVTASDQNKARNLLNLFPTYETPLLIGENTKDSQGSLLSGSYYPIISYELTDGSLTSWSKPYNGIPIFSDNQLNVFEQVGGDVEGTITNKSIELTFSNVDLNYAFLHIGYISVIGGITSATSIRKYPIIGNNGSGIDTTMTIEILGNESTISSLVLTDVLVPNAVYNGNQTITNVQGKLMLGNVSEPETINLQPFANEIQVQWLRERNITINGQVKSITQNGITVYGSYKDGSLVVFDKNFKAGECYALFIAARLKYGGIYTQAFHIPGKNTIDNTDNYRINVNDPTLTSYYNKDIKDLAGGSGIDVSFYELFDTSTQNSSPDLNRGKMGYWENENEEYPLDPNNQLNIHPDYSNIPGNNGNTFITKADRKIRHHIFPDLVTLKGRHNAVDTGSGIDTTGFHDFLSLKSNTLLEKFIEMTGGEPGHVLDGGGSFLGGLNNPVAGYWNYNYPRIIINSIGTGSLFTISLPGYIYSGNTSPTRIGGFTSNGILKISYLFTILNQLNTGTGDNFSGFPSGTWGDTSGGHLNFYFFIYKNGNTSSTVGNFIYRFDVGQQSPFLVFQNTMTNGFVDIPIAIGDYIDIIYHIESSTFNPVNPNVGATSLDFYANFGSQIDLDFKTASVDSEVLGLEFSNINIPQNIADKIDTIEFFYAKRTNSNIRIVAQDMVKESRFHNFDLMTTKAISNIDYMKPLLNYDDGSHGELTDTISNLGGGLVESKYTSSLTQKIIKSYNFLYIGQGTLYNLGGTTIDNTNKSDSIYINADSSLQPDPITGVPVINPQAILSTYQSANTLFDLCIFKRNIYFPFNQQELVTTGYCFKIDKTNPINITINGNVIPVYNQNNQTIKVYSGDTYINGFGFRDSISSNTPFYLGCESISNIGLRYQDSVNTKFYFPKNGTPTPSFYGYNTDYNCINNFNQLEIFFESGDCETDNITIFPYRIPYSIVDSTESKLLNWRIFKANSYYEMPKNKGVIINLLGENKELYIHHQYTLYLAQIKDQLQTGTTVTYLGFSDFFDRPPKEILPVNEGFAGTQSQFAIILCRLGYVFIDKQMGKIFVLRVTSESTELREISNQGLYNFFRNNLEYNSSQLDNPFIGEGFTLAYDEQMDRLIIVKNILFENGSGTDNGHNFTISYSPSLNQGKGGWLSFHDYEPHFIFFNRGGLFGIDNTRNKLFRHNSKLNKSIFYNNQIFPSYIEPIIKSNASETKRFDNINWLTNVEGGSGVDYENITLTNLVIYNNNQCTGIINLTQDNGLWFGHDVRNVEGTWNFNEFKDIVINQNIHIIDQWGNINVSNLNINKAWFEQSEFISKFVVCRLIYDNQNQYNIHIIAVDSNMIKSNRG